MGEMERQRVRHTHWTDYSCIERLLSQFQYIKSTSTIDPKDRALGDSGACLLKI